MKQKLVVGIVGLFLMAALQAHAQKLVPAYQVQVFVTNTPHFGSSSTTLQQIVEDVLDPTLGRSDDVTDHFSTNAGNTALACDVALQVKGATTVSNATFTVLGSAGDSLAYSNETLRINVTNSGADIWIGNVGTLSEIGEYCDVNLPNALLLGGSSLSLYSGFSGGGGFSGPVVTDRGNKGLLLTTGGGAFTNANQFIMLDSTGSGGGSYPNQIVYQAATNHRFMTASAGVTNTPLVLDAAGIASPGVATFNALSVTGISATVAGVAITNSGGPGAAVVASGGIKVGGALTTPYTHWLAAEAYQYGDQRFRSVSGGTQALWIAYGATANIRVGAALQFQGATVVSNAQLSLLGSPLVSTAVGIGSVDATTKPALSYAMHYLQSAGTVTDCTVVTNTLDFAPGPGYMMQVQVMGSTNLVFTNSTSLYTPPAYTNAIEGIKMGTSDMWVLRSTASNRWITTSFIPVP